MSTYDLKRLEIAIQYIRRMSEGKNPVSNRPAPENEVLNNVNVHRCLKFIDEVLTDVHKNGGSVGLVSQRERKSRVPVSQTFPYEILDRYEYRQDQQISYQLRQLEEYLPEGSKLPVQATLITTWLRENGYLEIKAVNDTGRENSVPTTKGEDLGIYDERAGVYPNEYYRVFYNENAQRFIIQNFRKILTEAEAIRERNRKERKAVPLRPGEAAVLPKISICLLPRLLLLREPPVPLLPLPETKDTGKSFPRNTMTCSARAGRRQTMTSPGKSISALSASNTPILKENLL